MAVSIFGLVVGIAFLGALGMFFYRFRYVMKADLGLWGVYLLLDVIFPVLAVVTSKIVPALSLKQTTFLFDNILLIFECSLLIMVYHKNHKTDKNIVWAAYGVFLMIWLVEFGVNMNEHGIGNMDRIRVAAVFMRMLVVVGIWVYWANLYQTSSSSFKQNPFFWLTVGWFINYTLTSTMYFPNIGPITSINKIIMFGESSIASIFGLVCTIISFWLTKNWVLLQKSKLWT